jgi:hypothetical protein
MSMTPGQRAERLHQDRLELGNLRRGSKSDWGGCCASSGCLLLVVLLILLLLTAVGVGYGMWHQKHSHNSGLPAMTTTTLPAG